MRFAPNPSAGEPSTCNRGKIAKSCSREQNEALLLMLIFSRFQQTIQMEWPVKAPTERLWCGSNQTQGQDSPWLAILGQRQKLLPGAKPGTFANAGIFKVPIVDSGEMACKRDNRPTLMRFAPNQIAGEPSTCNRGKTAKSCSRERQEALCLMLVFSRFQQWIQMEWPVKAPTERLWYDSYQTQGRESCRLAVWGKQKTVASGSVMRHFC